LLATNVKKLNDWLNSIGLQQYFEYFIERGVHKIDKIIETMNTEDKFSYEDVFNIGVFKPGHIYKILTRLNFDAGNIDEKYYFFIFNDSLKHSITSLRMSSEKYVCCGQIAQPKINMNTISSDIIDFLKKAKAPHLRKNFVYNGFESIEYIYLQMFTDHAITDEILESKFHIYNRRDRQLVLKRLEEGINNIYIFILTLC